MGLERGWIEASVVRMCFCEGILRDLSQFELLHVRGR